MADITPPMIKEIICLNLQFGMKYIGINLRVKFVQMVHVSFSIPIMIRIVTVLMGQNMYMSLHA
jgi:hypothetical protein